MQGSASTASGSPSSPALQKGTPRATPGSFPASSRTAIFAESTARPGEPGYLLIEGKIAEDGSAKLSANGIVASRKYARGVFAHKGEDYSYNIKAQFKETEGTGTRNEGLGIVGRPCTFDFVKQQAAKQIAMRRMDNFRSPPLGSYFISGQGHFL